jgi:ribosomal protein S18 acetylase RimI-like enzyme
MNPFVCELLTSDHDRSSFRCGVAELDDYLQRRARQDARRHVAATYVMTPRDEPQRITGFYTLSAASIELSDLPSELAKHLPRYPHVPAILLGRLARDLKFKGQGIGELLLADALGRSVRHAQEVAAAVVLVDALDERARQFYRSFGFQEIPRLAKRLFIPIKTIEKLFPTI